MRLAALFVLLCSSVLAQTDADRQSLEKSIAAGWVFSEDGQRDWDRVRPPLQDSQRPMSEVSPPLLVLQRIQAVGDGFALVEANLTQFGSAMPAMRLPLLLVMRKTGERWRVDAVRLLQ